MPSAIRTTFLICCVPLDLLSRPLSFFIHMTNARKDYIGRELKNSFGFKSRLSNLGLIAIFTQLVVMACFKHTGECLWNYIPNTGVAGSNPAQIFSFENLVAQLVEHRRFTDTLSPLCCWTFE